MNQIFEILENKGVLKKDKVRVETLARFNKKQILELMEDLGSLTPPTDTAPNKHQLAHCASFSLGGGREECYNVGCRMQRLESLARFATLYSDKVYIRNYFASYDHLKNLSKDRLAEYFLDDIYLLSLIRPIMAAGLMEFMGGKEAACPKCLAARIGPTEKSSSYLQKAVSRLSLDYLNNTQVSLEKDEKEFILHLEGSELYYDHGGLLLVFNRIPNSLRSKPMLLSKLKKEGVIHLSKKEARKINFHKVMAQEVLENLTYEVIMKSELDTSFVTNREIHIAFLQKFGQDDEVTRRNQLAYKHMTALVPFLEDVPLGKLLKLRERERFSFLQFRAALNKSIDQLYRTKGKFSEGDAKSIYFDIIAPELARLDKRVKAAKKDLITSLIRSATGTLGAISFGLYTGIIPYEIASIAKALGLVKFGSDMIQKFMSLGDGAKTIQQKDLYFLWKVKQVADKT